MASSADSSNNKGVRVSKIGGAATTDGVDYENYMYLLVLMRLLENDRVEEFHITQNIDGVGAFDDLVIRVKYNPPGEEAPVQKLFLVQLKHRKSRCVSRAALTATTGGGDLRLMKYYEGYKMLLKKFGNFKDKVLNECEMNEVTMVIYTNADCPVGDNNCPADSVCRQLLETGDTASNIFSFNSSEQYKKFHEDMKKNKNPISEEEDGTNFLQQLVFFSDQCSISDLQEKVKNKLKSYMTNSNVHLNHILQNAVKFITRNNSMWMSLHSGVLSDMTFNYQGILVKLNDMKKLFGNGSICNDIIIKHICQDEDDSHVCVGKILKPIDSWYIDRIVVKTSIMSEEDKKALNNDRNSIMEDITVVEKLEKTLAMHAEKLVKESFVLLCGGPGMGKSSFFTKQAISFKELHPEKFVVREDLVEYSEYFNSLNMEDNNKELTEKFLMKIAGVLPDTVEYKVFQECLKTDQMMVIFLDGVDEVSPYYYEKILTIIQTIRAEFKVKLWVSTRPILENKMEKDIRAKSWTMQKFNSYDTHQFLEKYSGTDKFQLGTIAEFLCGIPMFCKMLGDVIKNNIHNTTHVTLSTITNKVQLYDSFIDVMYEVYHKEKEMVDVNTAAVRSKIAKLKRLTLSEYETAALLEVFSETELSDINFNIGSNCKDFLTEISEENEKMGLIVYNVEGKPRFIHRSIAEYFCGRWFAKNVECFKKYVKKYNKLPAEVDYFMSTKLDELDDMFSIILLQQHESKCIEALKERPRDFNRLDPLGRNIVHYADISKNEDALCYILFNGFAITEEFVRNFKFNDHVTGYKFKSYLYFYWLESTLKKYPEFAPLIGIKLFIDEYRNNVFYFLLRYCNNCPLHVAILNRKKSDISELLDQNINSRNELGLTSLHIAAVIDDWDTVRRLGELGADYCRNNKFYVYPHQIAKCHYTKAVKSLEQLQIYYNKFMIEESIVLDIKSQDYKSQNLPLHHMFQNEVLDKKKIDFDDVINAVNLRKVDSRGRTVLHVAAANSDMSVFYNPTFDMKAFGYTKDNDGFYPHDYVADVFIGEDGETIHIGHAQERFKYNGFAYGIKCLPKADRKLFGKRVNQFFSKF